MAHRPSKTHRLFFIPAVNRRGFQTVRSNKILLNFLQRKSRSSPGALDGIANDYCGDVNEGLLDARWLAVSPQHVPCPNRPFADMLPAVSPLTIASLVFVASSYSRKILFVTWLGHLLTPIFGQILFRPPYRLQSRETPPTPRLSLLEVYQSHVFCQV